MKEDKLYQSIQEKMKNHSLPTANSGWSLIQKEIQRRRRIKIMKFSSLGAAAMLALFLVISPKGNNLDSTLIVASENTELNSGTEQDAVTGKSAVSELNAIKPQDAIIEVEVVNNGTEVLMADYLKNDEDVSIISDNYLDGEGLIRSERLEVLNKILDENEKLQVIENKEDVSMTNLKEIHGSNRGLSREKQTKEKRSVLNIFRQYENRISVVDEDWGSNNRDLELSFNGGLAISQNTTSESGIYSLDMSKLAQGDVSNIAPMGVTSYSPFATNYKTGNKSFDYEFSRPISSLGVFGRKSLGEKFYLESGVYFGQMITHFYLTETGTEVGENNMWSVGIPLKLNYTLLDAGAASVYVLAGGAIEKVIFSKYSGERLYFDDSDIQSTLGNQINQVPMSTSDLKSSQFGFQFSLNAGIGAQVKLMELLAIFLEPSVSYYLNTETPIPTIKSERPLTLSVQAGLRFNL